MYQFFQQAEKWHLRLNADISEMQNKYNFHFNNLWVKNYNRSVHRELLQEMEKVESSYDIMKRNMEKKKLLPITDNVTNNFAEMLQKRLEQLENHNSKLEIDLKKLEDNVKIIVLAKYQYVDQHKFYFSSVIN